MNTIGKWAGTQFKQGKDLENGSLRWIFQIKCYFNVLDEYKDYLLQTVFEGFIVFIILIEINFIYRKKWPVI